MEVERLCQEGGHSPEGLSDREFYRSVSRAGRTSVSRYARPLDDPARRRVAAPCIQVRGGTLAVLWGLVLLLVASRLPADSEDVPIILSWEEHNETAVPVRADGRTAISEIHIQGAPPSATVAELDVHVSIVHPRPDDLTVKLYDQREANYSLTLRGPRVDGEHLTYARLGSERFNERPVNQRWYLHVRDDGQSVEGDNYIAGWWIKVHYHEPHTPPNDQADQSLRLFTGWPSTGWTWGATGEALATCDRGETADVWHWFTLGHAAPHVVTVGGSIPVKTLSVFDEQDGRELACARTDDTNSAAHIEVAMAKDHIYLIRVAAPARTNGNYVLCVRSAGPVDPHPGEGQVSVPTDVVLSWNGFVQPSETNQGQLDVPTCGSLGVGRESLTACGIYGDDDRLDEYEVADRRILAAGEATVVLVPRCEMPPTDRNTFELNTVSLAATYGPLCPEEPYSGQPCAGFCSGFLVAPDVIATAGHCVDDDTGPCILDSAAVFGFAMVDAEHAVTEVPAADVYFCTEVIGARNDSRTDWALVRLDRDVTGHSPLSLRRRGMVMLGAPMLAIGHPVGLPRKYALAGTVQANDPTLSYFETNLDTYHGNSGSAVLHAETLEVEGILVSGPSEDDFIEKDGCYRSVRCPDGGCGGRGWQDVTRAAEFGGLIPAFEVYLGTDPDSLFLVQDGLVLPCYRPDGLQPQTTYYWQVVAIGACGTREGPLWSFATGPDVSGPAAAGQRADRRRTHRTAGVPARKEVMPGF